MSIDQDTAGRVEVEPSAAQMEAALLANADLCMENVMNREVEVRLSMVQALYRIYFDMTKFQERYPAEATNALFIQYWGLNVSEAYEHVISEAIQQDPELIYTDWHIEWFDGRLTHISQGQQSLPNFLRYVDEHRHEVLTPDVSALWDSKIAAFHRENKSDCTAGGGCPASSCAAKAIMAAVAAKQGVREAGANT